MKIIIMEIPNKNNKNLLPEVIPVYLPDDEVKKFLVFQEFYDQVMTLVASKVFEQKDCTILLDFDNRGTLMKVRRNDVLFKK